MIVTHSMVHDAEGINKSALGTSCLFEYSNSSNSYFLSVHFYALIEIIEGVELATCRCSQLVCQQTERPLCVCRYTGVLRNDTRVLVSNKPIFKHSTSHFVNVWTCIIYYMYQVLFSNVEGVHSFIPNFQQRAFTPSPLQIPNEGSSLPHPYDDTT